MNTAPQPLARGKAVRFSRATAADPYRSARPPEWRARGLREPGGADGPAGSRREAPATTNGSERTDRQSVERTEWESDSSSVVAFAREDEGSRVVVSLNFSNGSETVRIGERVEGTDLVTGKRVPTATGRDSKTELSVSDVVVRTTEESK